MLSFKQYITKYPNGHKSASVKRTSQDRFKKKLSEGKSKSTEVEVLDKWELIRVIADAPFDAVEVTLKSEGVLFRFAEVEIDD